MRYIISFGFLCFLLFPTITHSQANDTSLQNQFLSTKTTWWDTKRASVIKQNVDYSCGSASLATILTYFYNQPTTESQVIKDLALNKQMASFQDLANVSQKYGFIGKGIATNYDSLKKIKIRDCKNFCVNLKIDPN